MRRRSGSSCGWAAEGAPIGCAFSLSALPAAAATPPTARAHRPRASEQERAAAWARVRGGGGARGGGSAARAAAQPVGLRRVARCVERRRQRVDRRAAPGAWPHRRRGRLLLDGGVRFCARVQHAVHGAAISRRLGPPRGARRVGGRRRRRPPTRGGLAAQPVRAHRLARGGGVYIVVSQRDGRVCAAALQPPPPAAAADGAKARGPSIGFVVLSAADVDAVRVRAARRGPEQLARHALRAEREVASDREVRLGAGAYALVPFTFAAGEAGAFEVEVFCSAPAAIELRAAAVVRRLYRKRARGAWRRRWAARRRRRRRSRTVARSCGRRRPARSTTTTCCAGGVTRLPAELIAWYRAEDDAAARAAALADAYLRQQVEELRGAPRHRRPAARSEARRRRPWCRAHCGCRAGRAHGHCAEWRRPRRWRPRRRSRTRRRRLVQRSYDQRSRNARADDILEAVMQRSRRR